MDRLIKLMLITNWEHRPTIQDISDKLMAHLKVLKSTWSHDLPFDILWN